MKIGLALRTGRMVNALLRRFGVECQYVSQGVSMHAALGRALARQTAINTVVDVGASDGRWSETARRYFPEADYLLFEANPVHFENLRAYREGSSKVSRVLSVASNRSGEVYFDDTLAQGGRASHRPLKGASVRLPATTIDAEVSARSLPAPFLLKLDTHGFEVPILQGARKVLGRTSLLIVECYNFRFAQENLLFPQMCRHLDSLGFRPIDLCGPLYRSMDGALWQFDLLFAPTNSPVFRHNQYEGGRAAS